MAQMPDSVNLTWLLTRGGVEPGAMEESSELAQAREGLRTLAKVRWAGLGALVLILGLVVLINKRSLPRMMVNAGIVPAISAAVYLGPVPGRGEFLGRTIEVQVESERAQEAAGGEPEFALVTARRVVTEVFSRVTGQATGQVSILLVAGIGLFGGGIVLHVVRRRRLQPRPQTVPPPPPPYAGPISPAYYPPASQ